MDEEKVREIVRQYLGQIIKVGSVASLDLAKHTVRVKYPEEGNNTTFDLAVLERQALKNKDHQMPDIDEDVLVIHLPEAEEEGFVLGSFYAGEVTPPSVNPDERRVVFSDEAYAVHNRKEHTLDFVTEDTHVHIDREKVTVDTPKLVRVTTTDIQLLASGKIDIFAKGNVTIKGANIRNN